MKYCAAEYDYCYRSQQAQEEDLEIRRLFLGLFQEETSWLDLGCGTGFGYSLLKNGAGYLGVDIDKDMIALCRKKFPKAKFIHLGAERVYPDDKKSIMALYSINYFSWKSIIRLAMHNKKGFIVSYSRPYMEGSASVYAGNRGLFARKHFLKSRAIAWILKMNGYHVFPLLGQPYYHVGVKHGRNNGAPESKVLHRQGVLENC